MPRKKKLTRPVKSFAVGDLVFGKVRGFVAWPGKVTQILPYEKYRVTFYGDESLAVICQSEMWPFDSFHKKKFVVEKELGKSLFRLAVEQAQADSAAIEGTENEDPISITFQPKEVISFTIVNIPSAFDDVKDENPEKVTIRYLPSSSKQILGNSNVSNFERTLMPPPKTENRSKNLTASSSTLGSKENVYPTKALVDVQSKGKMTKSQQEKARFRASKEHLLMDPVKVKFLKTQTALIDLNGKVMKKLSLVAVKMSLDGAIKDLKVLVSILGDIESLMVVKYPIVVDTISSLTRFVAPSQEKKAMNIRNLAKQVVAGFHHLFEADDAKSFALNYAKKRAEFVPKVQELGPMELFEVTSMEGSEEELFPV